MESKEVVFIVDNLRIGGIQRLVLDESYQFIEWGFKVSIISLAPPLQGDQIINVDRNFPLIGKIKIVYFRSNKFYQTYCFVKFLKKNKSQNIFISHSTTGAFLMKISSWIIFKKIKIILFIHQFLSLSKSIQALKRVFYSFFCDNLFFSSKQFLVNWEQIVKKNIILRLLSCKKTKFVRMGVYLPRLKYSDPRNYLRFKEYSPSLIYLSRLTEWKGFNKYLEICNSSLGLKMNCIIFATQINLIDTAKLFNSDLRSVQVLYETGVSEFRMPYGSVHIYPTDYGQLIDNPQSIGMNVLEMIAQGVPSIISTENFESWPELQQSILVRAVDWQDSAKLFEELAECLTISAESAELESKKLSSAIEISKHCITLNHFLK